MKIYPLKALSDNYIWCIEDNQQVMIIDPGQAEPVLTWLQNEGLTLKTILLTHKHYDHIDGVKALKDRYPDVIVYGPKEITEFTLITVSGGDVFEEEGRHFEVYQTAGHTAEHITYLMNKQHIFCGDALFSAGCGRVFTGDYASAFEGMSVFRHFDQEANLYPGHEYTLTNLTFAHDQKPDDDYIAQALVDAREKTAAGIPTVPTNMAHERRVNLFMMAKDLETFKHYRDIRDKY